MQGRSGGVRTVLEEEGERVQGGYRRRRHDELLQQRRQRLLVSDAGVGVCRQEDPQLGWELGGGGETHSGGDRVDAAFEGGSFCSLLLVGTAAR